MDLETTSVVAKVSSPSLIKLKINTANQNFQAAAAAGSSFEANIRPTFNEDNILTSDYLLNSTNISSPFPNINVVELPTGVEVTRLEDRSDYLNNCSLEPYCDGDSQQTNIASSQVGLLRTNYNPVVFENGTIDDDENSVAAVALKYHSLVSSSSTNETDPVEFISPASILEANSQLVDPQDKADFTALDEYLNITDEIEPHFIVGSFGENEKLVNNTDENHIDSTVNMGIENAWNEDFAVPSTSTFPLPLPAPPERSAFNDFPTCTNFDGVEDDSYDLEALFSCNEPEIDITDTAAEVGVCGLRNLGNTCFMSAGIQCLAATQSLVQSFVHNLHSQQLDENSLTMQFTDLLQRMWSGQYSVVNPVQFKQALGTYHSQFKDSGQHDCQEFLALLLDALHQQLLTASKEISEANSFEFNEKMDIGVDFQRPASVVSSDTSNNYVANNSISCNNANDSLSVDKNSEVTILGENWDDVSNTNESNSSNKQVENEADNSKDSSNRSCTTAAVVVECATSTSCSTDNPNDQCLIQNVPVDDNNKGFESEISNDDEVAQSFVSSTSAGIGGGTSSSSSGDGCAVLASKLNHIEDIFKEAKTSNVNVSTTRMETNNDICFDSEKFPKKERRRNIADANYYDGMYPNVAKVNNKNASCWIDEDCNIGDNLDLKRIKVNHLHKEKNCLLDTIRYSNEKIEKNVLMEQERQHKVLNVDVNVKMNKEDIVMETEEECNSLEVNEAEMCDVLAARTVDDELQSADDLEAEKQWQRHVQYNQSVIFNSFQGQFKNTVVCSACDFKSVTYEPFMYLSVPLPHAIEKQLCVIFVPASPRPPVKYLITLTKQDEVYKIKQHLLKLIPETLTHPLVVSEVLDYHIAKILDDNYQVRYVDDVNRSIYAFEQLQMAPINNCDAEFSAKFPPNGGDKKDVINNSAIKSETCTICLEEKESDIKKHKDCECILCDVCIQNYAQHSGDTIFKCPVCRCDITPGEDLVSIEQADMKPNTRLLNVPLVYRINKVGDGNNNQKSVKLFGHPALLKLPNQLSTTELYEMVSSLNPYQHPYELLLVDGQGRHCSRCMFNQHCKGCVIPRDSHISLRSDDTLAVTFTEDVEEIAEIHHSSMSLQRSRKTLSLYDCVQAFSQSEILDEYNPWYCPQCKKNQCATKTLSVWRFPNYLIVYLKRFVFHECTSIKLEDKVMFPLHDFSFNQKKESSYDLYACVCHTGGVSVGHYVAYTQHPLTNEWHCYNDENVLKQKPQDEEYCNAYILFYKKKNAE